MKRLFIFFCALACVTANAYYDLEGKALEEINTYCNTSYSAKDIISVEEVDSDYDYSSHSVLFKSGGVVYLTVTRDQQNPGEYKLWIDEIYCK